MRCNVKHHLLPQAKCLAPWAQSAPMELSSLVSISSGQLLLCPLFHLSNHYMWLLDLKKMKCWESFSHLTSCPHTAGHKKLRFNTRSSQVTTLHHNRVACSRQLWGNCLSRSDTERGNFELWTGGLKGSISRPGAGANWNLPSRALLHCLQHCALPLVPLLCSASGKVLPCIIEAM